MRNITKPARSLEQGGRLPAAAGENIKSSPKPNLILHDVERRLMLSLMAGMAVSEAAAREGMRPGAATMRITRALARNGLRSRVQMAALLATEMENERREDDCGPDPSTGRS